MKIYLVIALLILTPIIKPNFAQSKTNLDIIDELIGKAILKVDSSLLEEKTINLKISIPPRFEILRSSIINNFIKKNFRVTEQSELKGSALDFYLPQIEVEYKETRKEGLLEDFILDRNIKIKGNFIITSKKGETSSIEFEESYIDSINVDSIASVEDESLPFTRAEIQKPSFFSNLFEPIVVISSLIVTVVLLFTVRGK